MIYVIVYPSLTFLGGFEYLPPSLINYEGMLCLPGCPGSGFTILLTKICAYFRNNIPNSWQIFFVQITETNDLSQNRYIVKGFHGAYYSIVHNDGRAF